MNIPASQVEYRSRIGKAGNRTVYGVGLMGGLHLVIATRAGGGFETLGAGSHKAIARHIAKQHSPDLEFDGLTKSEDLPVAYFADMLPQYLDLTAQLRRRQGL